MKLLETIEKNGEFESYVSMLAEREERERKQLRKRERERQRLADGDARISEESETEEEPPSDWSNSTEEEPDGSDEEMRPGTPSQKTMFKKSHTKFSDTNEMGMRFNALRFLALSLKSENDTMGK